ncbi:FHA domain-containing protein [Nannocystaceae bacterium ST9]
MSKTVHQFECRDDVWKRVEALAKRRGVTTDEIIQAALIQLFTRKKADDAAEAASEAGTGPVPARAAGSAPPPRPAAPPGPPRPAAGLPRPSGAAGPSRLPPPSTRPTAGPPAGAPTPGAAASPAATPGRNRPLYLFFEGNWYTVDQDQFVIGRGSKFSDLPIKDANISRRHCAVVRRNGEYFIKDLGSTNGIEFAGQRVDDHRVEEGNVYYLCDHEIRFTFQAPY